MKARGKDGYKISLPLGDVLAEKYTKYWEKHTDVISSLENYLETLSLFEKIYSLVINHLKNLADEGYCEISNYEIPNFEGGSCLNWGLSMSYLHLTLPITGSRLGEVVAQTQEDEGLSYKDANTRMVNKEIYDSYRVGTKVRSRHWYISEANLKVHSSDFGSEDRVEIKLKMRTKETTRLLKDLEDALRSQGIKDAKFDEWGRLTASWKPENKESK